VKSIKEKLNNYIFPIIYDDDNIDIEFIYSRRHTKGFKNVIKYNKPDTISGLYDILYKIMIMGSAMLLEKYILMYGDNLGEIRYNKSCAGSSITLDNMVSKYGVIDGTKKFNIYRNRQSYSNSYEYKFEKYGMSKEEYNSYNKSRAVTLDNMVSRHGVIDGTKKFNIYRNRQSYTNSEEYLGKEKYKEVNSKKANTIENFITRYGKEVGISKFEKYINKMPCGYSKISQELFWNILDKTDIFSDAYFAERNNEYGVMDIVNNRYFKYDFVSINMNIVIEFQGDHYHGNPKMYKPYDYLCGKGCTNIIAKDKWIYDKQKEDLIKEKRGFETIFVWESDYRDDKDFMVKRIIDYVKNRI